MDLQTFTPFSLVHIVTLAACLLIAVATTLAGVRRLRYPRKLRLLRRMIVLGCVSVWLLNTSFWLHPNYFRWEGALPLQFCNLANLIGALAVARKIRVAQSVLYFWSFALCIWAFLTPSLDQGPARIGFWIFWAYHLFILISVLFVLTVDRFRPAWRDCFSAIGITLSYMALLAIINHFTGWNYGFVGAGSPIHPSPVDALGPYPLRLVWMALIGSAIFIILLLPWLRSHRFSLSET